MPSIWRADCVNPLPDGAPLPASPTLTVKLTQPTGKHPRPGVRMTRTQAECPTAQPAIRPATLMLIRPR
ncbi:hypothetical protein LY78DRAFT_277187 [Colletotrichum sublineola]|nr:hypothetical protein LY78DRAFT_277187 [Colletotrichum sublineola]